KKTDNKNVKGGSICDLFANIFIVAKKNSGKTNLINTLLKHFVTKKTELIIFASTVEIDPTWKAIVKQFEKLGNNVITYQSLEEDGIKQVGELTRFLQENAGIEEEPEVKTDYV